MRVLAWLLLGLTFQVLAEPKFNIDRSYEPSNLDVALPGNYISFVSRLGVTAYSRQEVNGWFLLEDNLRTALGYAKDPYLEEALQGFANGPFAGWWPAEFYPDGKRYFLDGPPVQLYFDADDTAWLHSREERTIDDKTLSAFISDEPLPHTWRRICQEIACDASLIARVWHHPDWHDEIDLATTSSLLAVLDPDSSELARRAFAANVELLNHTIKIHKYKRRMGYYEPAVTGAFLILFNNARSQTPFLNLEAESILRVYLEQDLELLEQGKMQSRWGAGSESFGGYQIVCISERLPVLMLEYSRRFLLASE